MKIGKEDINHFMTFPYEFTGTRLMEGYIQPVRWNIEISMVAICPDFDEQANEEVNIIFNKMLYWLDTVMSNVVICDINDKDAMGIMTASENSMMYCPGIPSDDILVKLLHSKINAIVKPFLTVGKIKLKGSDQLVSYTFWPDKKIGYELPELIKDYCPVPCRHEEPWWKRADGFCFELLEPDSMSREEIEELYSKIEDPLDQYDQHTKTALDCENSESSDNVIEVSWSPSKVE